MKINWKTIGIHSTIVLGFIIVAVAYFYPVLQDKIIYQSDIVQYIGMAQDQKEHIEKYDEQPYWIDNAFGGMPAYQVGANYPHHYIKSFDRFLRFLPRPADYLIPLFYWALYLISRHESQTAYRFFWGVGVWVFNLSHHHSRRWS